MQKDPVFRLPLFLIAPLFLSVFPESVLAQGAVEPVAVSWVSILPPVLAIVMALALRQVIPALFLGVWFGAWALNDFTLAGLWTGMLQTFQLHVLRAVADPDHVSVILFSLMIGGTVGIITRNGGMQGVVGLIATWADSARRACLATAAMGVAVFFDDYANTLVVGNTMRPVTDAMKVSRAKLAYIVDSTAAPVSTVALVTTWIGYQVGLIGDSLSNIPDLNIEAYLLFLSTIPYSFYPLLAVAFVFMVAASGRDFGPMAKSEARARLSGAHGAGHLEAPMAGDEEQIAVVEGKPLRAINAVLPILALLIGVMGGLYLTGKAAAGPGASGFREIIGAADSYKALMWGSMIGMMTAAALTLAQRILSLEEVVNAWYKGLRSMFYAMIILVLAWSLGGITEEMHTAAFLVSVLGDTLPVQLVPCIVFVLAAFTAFATGSSWGSMGILIPLVLPLTWAVMTASGHAAPGDMHLLYSSIAGVLAGSVWGDHCSPISDTTILSSMASGCDHVEHVRTQMPYAIVVGVVSMAVCLVPVAYGLPWWAGLGVSGVLLYLVLRIAGQKVQEP
jgi:Na+/H+ antiporter NhaC